MRNKKVSGNALCFVFLFVFTAVFSFVPLQDRPLTNDDVLRMVKEGASEGLIALSFKGRATDFDTSPDALVSLESAGVPLSVIELMMSATDKTFADATNSVTSDELVLKDGTEVVLRTVKPVSSATARIGDVVELEAAQDVVVDGVIVIAKGAHGRGEVVEAQKKRSFGRRGKLNFTIDVVQAVDGQNIRLRSTREISGADSYGKAGVVTILAGPFGAFVKGKDVAVDVGTEYTIYIDGDRTVKLAGGAL